MSETIVILSAPPECRKWPFYGRAVAIADDIKALTPECDHLPLVKYHLKRVRGCLAEHRMAIAQLEADELALNALCDPPVTECVTPPAP